MNHTLLLAAVALAPSIAFAQPGRSPDAEPTPPAAATVLRNHSILEFGSATPGGRYAAMPSQTGYVYFNESAISPVFNAGQGASGGGFIAYHRVEYLGIGALPPSFRIGLDLALAGAYDPVNWTNIYNQKPDASNGDGLLDATIGPVLSYNPTGSLVFDATARLGMGAAGGSSVSVSNYRLSDGSVASVEDKNQSAAGGMSSAFGLRIRYGAFMFGWEAHSNSGARNHAYSMSTDRGANADFNYTVTSAMPTSRLSFGLVF